MRKQFNLPVANASDQSGEQFGRALWAEQVNIIHLHFEWQGNTVRGVISKPANGTASAATTDKIGVMPDFAKILANEFMP